MRNSRIRKFYEDKTGRELPKDFHVHHIDFNGTNDDILNLIALPKKLHSKYHTTFAPVYLNENFFKPEIWETSIDIRKIDIVLEQFQKMRDVYAEFAGWHTYRNGLLGLIHNFTPYKQFYY
jgi:hypothetical protein